MNYTCPYTTLTSLSLLLSSPSHLLISFSSTPTATAKNYTLSLHDALPILEKAIMLLWDGYHRLAVTALPQETSVDRKSTRLNSSHLGISYAVFCLKKKMIRRALDSRMYSQWTTMWRNSCEMRYEERTDRS